MHGRHQAGGDSFMTAMCYFKLKDYYYAKSTLKMSNVLYGLNSTHKEINQLLDKNKIGEEDKKIIGNLIVN